MKVFTKLLAVILAGTMLFCMVSCDINGKNPEDTTADNNQENPTYEVVNLVENGKTSYVLVYPEDASTNIMRGVNNFIDTIEKYTGVKISKKDDFLGKNETPGEKEILVGLTNRQESIDVAATLRAGDYIVTVKNGKMLICGVTEASVSNALIDFVNFYLKKDTTLTAGTDNYSFSTENEYKYIIDYAIQHLTIGGANIKNFRIVVPQDAYVEYYFALNLKKHLATYAGFVLDVVTDLTPAVENEILLGKTNRTTITTEDDHFKIAVTGTKLQILADTDFGYPNAYTAAVKQVFPYSVRENALDDTLIITGDSNNPTDLEKLGTLRIMYQNIWGYLDGSNPILCRADMALTTFKAYQPDVLCFEEMSAAYRSTGAALMTYLYANYKEICDSNNGGIGNPIFYNSNTLTLVERGYQKARSGDKGTTWAVFTEKATGKTFAVTNSHFAANSNAGGNSNLGNTYRTQDANCVVSVTDDILEKYPGIPVFSGGDYNSRAGEDPINVLTTAGFVEVNSLAEIKSTRAPYHGSFSYDNNYGFHYLQTWIAYPVGSAIDHLMTRGGSATIHCYTVVQDPISLTTSDHAPHYIDVTLQ